MAQLVTQVGSRSYSMTQPGSQVGRAATWRGQHAKHPAQTCPAPGEPSTTCKPFIQRTSRGRGKKKNLEKTLSNPVMRWEGSLAMCGFWTVVELQLGKEEDWSQTFYQCQPDLNTQAGGASRWQAKAPGLDGSSGGASATTAPSSPRPLLTGHSPPGSH